MTKIEVDFSGVVPVKGSFSGRTEHSAWTERCNLSGPVTKFVENIGPVTFKPSGEMVQVEYYYKGILVEKNGVWEYTPKESIDRCMQLLELKVGHPDTVIQNQINKSKLSLKAVGPSPENKENKD